MGILRYILIVGCCLVWSAHVIGANVKDTIEYRAQVWIDKTDLERYGGEADFKKNLKKMFHNTTRFWNESPNKFNHYFRFVPVEELYVYDIQGNRDRYDEFKDKAFGPMDTDKADFVLFMALDAKKGGLSCGRGGKSGQAVVMCYIKAQQNIFTDALYPNQGTYSNLGHEYGHVRGAADMYQYLISAEKNPISHERFDPPKCNMGTGYRMWSDYCSALFNFEAYKKQVSGNLDEQTFPQKMKLKVTKNGKSRKGVTINFYGTRAGFRDVYPQAFRTLTTDRKGEVLVENVYKLYYPDLDSPGVPPKQPKDEFPYSRWYCFLLEVIDGDTKEYVWLPDFEIRTDFLVTGRDTYEQTISL